MLMTITTQIPVNESVFTLEDAYTVDVHPHQQLPNCGRRLSQSRDRPLEYGLCCPGAQSLKCQVGIVKKD
jgi:hypothetical protein